MSLFNLADTTNKLFTYLKNRERITKKELKYFTLILKKPPG